MLKLSSCAIGTLALGANGLDQFHYTVPKAYPLCYTKGMPACLADWLCFKTLHFRLLDDTQKLIAHNKHSILGMRKIAFYTNAYRLPKTDFKDRVFIVASALFATQW